MARIARKHVIGGVVVLVTALIAAFVLRPEIYEVEVGVVDRGLIRATLDEDGVVRMRRHEEVAAPVAGRLAESLLRAGDSVTRGMVVARLNPAPLDRRAREQAEAALATARYSRREAAAMVQQARIALETASRERGRAQRLLASGAIATREHEEAVDLERTRQRELQAAIAHESAAAQDERRIRTGLVGADPDARQNGSVLLRASMSGRVLRVLEEHDRVVPAGTVILEIGDPASLELVIDVLTTDARAVTPGAPITAQFGRGETAIARVVRVERAAFTKVSPLGVEEQRVNVIGEFTTLPAGLGDGFQVDASIILWELPDALRLPGSALVSTGAQWGVFSVEQGIARWRSVEVGRRGDREVEVVSGLEEGAVVIVYPENRLGDGARVAVIRR